MGGEYEADEYVVPRSIPIAPSKKSSMLFLYEKEKGRGRGGGWWRREKKLVDT